MTETFSLSNKKWLVWVFEGYFTLSAVSCLVSYLFKHILYKRSSVNPGMPNLYSSSVLSSAFPDWKDRGEFWFYFWKVMFWAMNQNSKLAGGSDLPHNPTCICACSSLSLRLHLGPLTNTDNSTLLWTAINTCPQGRWCQKSLWLTRAQFSKKCILLSV